MVKYKYFNYKYFNYKYFNYKYFNYKYLLLIIIIIIIIYILFTFYQYNTPIENFRNRTNNPEQHITFNNLINNYGETGIKSIQSELNNFIQKKVFEPEEYINLINNNIINDTNSLNSFIFGKIKPSGELKSRLIGYMDKNNPYKKILGSLYRTKYKVSPVKIQTIRLQLNIASFEKRILYNIDIKSAYLNADLPKPYYMKIKGELVKILCDLDSSYTKYITEEGYLYLKVKKAIYGLHESGYLWYKNLSTNLKNFGYKISKFDPSFMYHPINKTHLSIYVDDILISAKEQKYITELMNYLRECYGELNDLTSINGEINYIGISIKKYTTKNNDIIKINQPNLIKKNILKINQTDILKVPYNDNLFMNNQEFFNNNNETDIISQIRSIMYIAQRTRPDISFPIYYLLKNFKQNDNPLLNLNNIYNYMENTRDLGISLSPNHLDIYGWVDCNEFNQLVIIISFGEKKANLIFYSIKQLDINHYFFKNDEYGKNIKFKNSFNIINSDKFIKKIVDTSFINILIIKKLMEELGYYQNKITINLNITNIKKMNNLINLIDNQEIIDNIDFVYIESDKMLTNILSSKLEYTEFNKKCKKIF